MSVTGRYHPRNKGNGTSNLNNQSSSGIIRDAESWLTCHEYDCYQSLVNITNRTEEEEARFQCFCHKVRNRRKGVRRSC